MQEHPAHPSWMHAIVHLCRVYTLDCPQKVRPRRCDDVIWPHRSLRSGGCFDCETSTSRMPSCSCNCPAGLKICKCPELCTFAKRRRRRHLHKQRLNLLSRFGRCSHGKVRPVQQQVSATSHYELRKLKEAEKLIARHGIRHVLRACLHEVHQAYRLREPG